MLTQPAPRTARPPAALWAYITVFALGCVAYAALAGMYFVKDDLALSRLTDLEGRPSVDALIRNFLWPAPDTHPQIYRPVPILFGWFDLCMFGVDPAGFRICNIGFHGLNGVLVALLFNQLTRFRRVTAGLFCGALFALHPLHGEAVLWVTQRMVVLCATFSLLALIGFEAFLSRKSLVGLVTCIASSIAAALCKEVTIALPGVMVLMALLHGPATPKTRLGRALMVAVPGAVLGFSVMLVRKILFGDWVGTYTNLTPREYATHFRVFERLPQSLLDGLWSVNVLEVPRAARLGFGVAWLAFLAIALLRLVKAARDRALGRAAVVFLGFAAASFVPTLLVFYIEPTLFNARFLYQPLIGLIGMLIVGFARQDSRRPLLALAAPAALVVLFALAGQWNLRAFAGADRQIRTVREGILREAQRTTPPPVVFVYRSPAEYHGVPTLDLSLAPAMRPPFVPPPGLEVVPLVAGVEKSWKAVVLAERARLASAPDRRILHLVAAENPTRLSPLVGDLEGPSGATPPEILAPVDGAILLHPEEPPTFVFQRLPSAVRYAFHFRGPRTMDFELLPERDLKRLGTRLAFGGEAMAPAWTAVGSLPSPVAIAWSVEAFDETGASLGCSGSRAMVVLTERGG